MVSGFFNLFNRECRTAKSRNRVRAFHSREQEEAQRSQGSGQWIYHLRNKTRAELEEKEALLVDINDQLEVALDEGDDEIALTLSDEQLSLEGSVESLRRDLENYESQCESAMDALNSHTNHIRNCKKKSMRCWQK